MKKGMSTKILVSSAILAAVSIVLTRFLSVMLTESLRIGFGTLPIMLSGYMFGPFAGALTGIVADLVGVMINPMGTYHLGFTLSSMLQGLLPGLVSVLLMKNREKLDIVNLLIGTVLVYLGVHLLLNTLWLSQLQRINYLTILSVRALKVLIEAVINAIILKIIYDMVVPKIKNL